MLLLDVLIYSSFLSLSACTSQTPEATWSNNNNFQTSNLHTETDRMQKLNKLAAVTLSYAGI